MRTWLCFIVLMFLLIIHCRSVKHAYDGTDSVSMGKGRGTRLGSSFSTEIQSKIDEEAQRRGQEYRNQKNRLFTTGNAVSRSQQRDLTIGAPSLSDACFRVYNDCIVVNAQPYERRSSVQVEKCKQRCMQSQSGVYSCRSFVYHVVNEICDFFAGQGDLPPAKLSKYYEHLYLEPTFDDGCDLKYAEKQKKTIDAAGRERGSSTLLNALTREDRKQETCKNGEVVKYLRTHGFMFDSANGMDLRAYNLDICIDACTNNVDDKGQTFECRSFDYSENGCSLFGEAATTTRGTTLEQNPYADYYEKICVESDLISNECQVVNRFPQMLLVGFAERVVTAPSFMGCSENCLKSLQLFSMNCTSAIFFYEETDQNCILNSENRQTQKNLFVEEKKDVVDYFEINCAMWKQKKVTEDS